jgi:hypothetical protein
MASPLSSWRKHFLILNSTGLIRIQPLSKPQVATGAAGVFDLIGRNAGVEQAQSPRFHPLRNLDTPTPRIFSYQTLGMQNPDQRLAV